VGGVSITVHHGDSMEVLKSIPDGSVDSCATDAPYALTSILKRFGKVGAAPAKSTGKTGAYQRASAGFMGQRWDNGETAHNPAFWAEVCRVLKPGAHLVAFSGTRTQHRQVCAIEDGGFEIRDTILDLVASDTLAMGFFASLSDEQQRAFARVLEDAGVGGMLAWAFGSGFPKSHNQKGEWEGWGSALKPAFEPICIARKPMIGTIAGNLAAHRAGALNIDACRIGAGQGAKRSGEASAERRYTDTGATNFAASPGPRGGDAKGRWPANLIHDGSDEVTQAFPESAGQQGVVTGDEPSSPFANVYGDMPGRNGRAEPRGDTGSAARFFYSSKADAEDRLGSKHPTIKPVDLMAWLCRLVTPPGGTVLDPFAGTGTTGLAAMREGFSAILIEREADFVADIHRRIAWANGAGRLTAQEKAKKPDLGLEGLSLFSGDAA
jgi:DNA modification methylase